MEDLEIKIDKKIENEKKLKDVTEQYMTKAGELEKLQAKALALKEA